jgi:hypothetical protein
MAIMENHKKALPYAHGPAMVRAAIMRFLLDQDNSVTLAVFVMLINPEVYEPKVGKSFNYWTWPKTDYEMDHGGQFIETNRDRYVYSGGETKWSHSSTYATSILLITTVVHDARDQVEERVRILDGVMNLGYYKRTTFALRVFVPTLGTSHIETKVNKPIKVVRRRQLPDGVDKSIQTGINVVAEGVVDGNGGPGRMGDNDDGAEEVSILLPETIEYTVKTETLET